jgi:hypothetical protein
MILHCVSGTKTSGGSWLQPLRIPALTISGSRAPGNLREAKPLSRQRACMGEKSALEPGGTGDEGLTGLVQCGAEELSPCICRALTRSAE